MNIPSDGGRPFTENEGTNTLGEWHKMKEEEMKKLIALLLALIMVFALVACGEATRKPLRIPLRLLTKHPPERK